MTDFSLQERQMSETLFRLAFEKLSPELLERSLALGADPNWRLTDFGAIPVMNIERSALIQTIYRHEPESLAYAKALLNAGADIEPRDSAHHSDALAHCCCPEAGLPVEKALLFLERGANPNFTGAHGRRSAHIACWREDRHEISPALLTLLAAAGAEMGALDDRGLSPMDLAIENGNLPALQTLWEMNERVDESAWDALWIVNPGRGKTAHWPAAKALMSALEERSSLDRATEAATRARPPNSRGI